MNAQPVGALDDTTLQAAPPSVRDCFLALGARAEDQAAEVRLSAALAMFQGRIGMVSSFGAESAVLLHMIGRLAPALPVIFLDTQKLFGETKRYRDSLTKAFGLTDVRTVTPDVAALAERDPDGMLFLRDGNACCHLRKTEPLQRALQGFDAWITGRKRYQGGDRSILPVVEFVDGRVKLNPLADWDADRIQEYMERYALPRHPLEADGFLSIGCMPCTDRVSPGEDRRAGRWRGQDKTECGIHVPTPQVAELTI